MSARQTPCSQECREAYPSYGVAPHECFFRKPGGFQVSPLGSSTTEPVSTWPDNFFAEIDKSQSVIPQLAEDASLCGVYLCPECLDLDKLPDIVDGLVGKHEILAMIEAETQV